MENEKTDLTELSITELEAATGGAARTYATVNGYLVAFKPAFVVRPLNICASSQKSPQLVIPTVLPELTRF